MKPTFLGTLRLGAILPTLACTMYITVAACYYCFGELDRLCLWGYRSEYGFCVNPPEVAAAEFCAVLSLAGCFEAFAWVTTSSLLTPSRSKAVAWVFYGLGALNFNSYAIPILYSELQSNDSLMVWADIIVIALTNLTGLLAVLFVNSLGCRGATQEVSSSKKAGY